MSVATNVHQIVFQPFQGDNTSPKYSPNHNHSPIYRDKPKHELNQFIGLWAEGIGFCLFWIFEAQKAAQTLLYMLSNAGAGDTLHISTEKLDL